MSVTVTEAGRFTGKKPAAHACEPDPVEKIAEALQKKGRLSTAQALRKKAKFLSTLAAAPSPVPLAQSAESSADTPIDFNAAKKAHGEKPGRPFTIRTMQDMESAEFPGIMRQMPHSLNDMQLDAFHDVLVEMGATPAWDAPREHRLERVKGIAGPNPNRPPEKPDSSKSDKTDLSENALFTRDGAPVTLETSAHAFCEMLPLPAEDRSKLELELGKKDLMNVADILRAPTGEFSRLQITHECRAVCLDQIAAIDEALKSAGMKGYGAPKRDGWFR